MVLFPEARRALELAASDPPVWEDGYDIPDARAEATAAGLATLRLATDEVYAHVSAAGDTIKAAATQALTAAGVGHLVQATGTMFSVFLTDPAAGPVRDFAGASRTDTAAYAAFFHAMLDRGVHLPPSAYEAWFLSAAHDDRAVQTVLDALPDAARAAAAAQENTSR